MPNLPSKGRREMFSGGFQSLMSNIAGMLDLKEPMAFLGLDRSYLTLRRGAMATTFEIILPIYEKMESRKAATRALDEIGRMESLLSIWRGDTEFKRLNENAFREPVPVSPEIFELIALAKKIHSQTGGAFDITATPLARCWGFFQRKGRMPTHGEIADAKNRVGMQHVELNEDDRTVRFGREGLELTPASLGKGLAIDHAVAKMRADGLKTVLMNGGFSSIYALGRPAWKDHWQFTVRDPVGMDRPLVRFSVRDRGFSSSGREEQNFTHQGRVYGHIIDPRTGYPAEELLSVNVLAPSAAEAEALSTAFYVMGVEKTLEYCENHADIGVFMVKSPDENGKSALIAANLGEDCLEVMNESCQIQRWFTN